MQAHSFKLNTAINLTNMKKIILIFAIVFSFKAVLAQEPSKILNISLKDKKNKLVELQTYNEALYVEGYDGDELIIEPYNPPNDGKVSEEPFIKNNFKWVDNIKLRGSKGTLRGEQEAGLKDITALTNRIPLIVETKAPVIRETEQLLLISTYPTAYKNLLVKIPRNTHFRLDFQDHFPDTKVSLKNLTGELEIRGTAPLIEVSNVSGALSLSSSSLSLLSHSIYSNLLNHPSINISHIKWDNDALINKKPLIFLSANTDDIDISLPADLKATVRINANYGDIYSDFDIVKKYPGSNELNAIYGDVNGGGPYIVIIANYGNVYLRKEK